MNYKNIYDRLIERGKERELKTYSEKHHIVPRCLGGSDSKENLVRLTPEEHYLAHQLLTKIYPKEQALVYAAMAMIRKRPGNKFYGWLRRKYAKVVSLRQAGSLNNNFGTKWISNVEEKVSKRINKDDTIPVGWIAGRNKWNTSNVGVCKVCKQTFSRTGRAKYCSTQCKRSALPDRKYLQGYTVEVDGVAFKSISEAADTHKIGHETARMRFKSNSFPQWKIIRV